MALSSKAVKLSGSNAEPRISRRGGGADLLVRNPISISASATLPLMLSRKAPESGFELLVVDRDEFALELARESVRSGLPRSPVR